MKNLGRQAFDKEITPSGGFYISKWDAFLETKTGLIWGCLFVGIGAGGIKPTVSTLIAEQVLDKNRILLEKIMSYLYVAINIGSCIAFLVAEPILTNDFLITNNSNQLIKSKN